MAFDIRLQILQLVLFAGASCVGLRKAMRDEGNVVKWITNYRHARLSICRDRFEFWKLRMSSFEDDNERWPCLVVMQPLKWCTARIILICCACKDDTRCIVSDLHNLLWSERENIVIWGVKSDWYWFWCDRFKHIIFRISYVRGGFLEVEINCNWMPIVVLFPVLFK